MLEKHIGIFGEQKGETSMTKKFQEGDWVRCDNIMNLNNNTLIDVFVNKVLIVGNYYQIKNYCENGDVKLGGIPYSFSDSRFSLLKQVSLNFLQHIRVGDIIVPSEDNLYRFLGTQPFIITHINQQDGLISFKDSDGVIHQNWCINRFNKLVPYIELSSESRNEFTPCFRRGDVIRKKTYHKYIYRCIDDSFLREEGEMCNIEGISTNNGRVYRNHHVIHYEKMPFTPKFKAGDIVYWSFQASSYSPENTKYTVKDDSFIEQDIDDPFKGEEVCILKEYIHHGTYTVDKFTKVPEVPLTSQFIPKFRKGDIIDLETDYKKGLDVGKVYQYKCLGDSHEIVVTNNLGEDFSREIVDVEGVKGEYGNYRDLHINHYVKVPKENLYKSKFLKDQLFCDKSQSYLYIAQNSSFIENGIEVIEVLNRSTGVLINKCPTKDLIPLYKNK